MRGARGGPSLAGLRKAGWRITVGKRRRRGRDRADGRPACPASPALSPRRFRGRHRAVCYARLSAGLRTHGREGRAFFLRPPLPRARPQCWWRVRSQLPLRGSAGVARTRHRLPVLIPWLATTGTDGHNIVGHAGSVNTKCCVEQRVSDWRGFHGFLLRPACGEKVPEGRMRGRRDDDPRATPRSRTFCRLNALGVGLRSPLTRLRHPLPAGAGRGDMKP